MKLYKCIFRGIGWVLLAGLITNLYLAISWHRHHARETSAMEHRLPGEMR